MSKLLDHVHCHFTQLFLVPDGLLTAIEGKDNRRRVIADRRFERGQIDRWTGKCRIASYRVVNRVESRYQTVVRQTEETKQHFQLLHFGHTLFSLFGLSEFGHGKTWVTGEGRPGTFSPSHR